MKKLLLSMATVPLVIGGLSASASADDGINILNDVKLKAQIRPRYENVDDGTTNANANAYTVRTKLSVTAGLLGVDGLSATIGIISVNNLGSHEYNAKDGKGYTDGSGNAYAVVLDPQKAMISNAAINYTMNDTTVHAGRGQVNLDNQRFIGTVGWRQLERSYDSVFVANNSIENLSVLVAWVYGLEGVGSIPNPAANPLLGEDTYDTNTVLLHAAYTVMPELKITAYDYMISSVSDTYGIALTGKINAGPAKLNYRAEYAQQSDATMEIHVQTPTTGQADADYINLDLGANINGILVGVNYEVLSGKEIGAIAGGNTAFATPLATGHKFNGWADIFLTTPSGGLEDANIRLGYKAKGFGKLLAVYHDFSTDKAMTVGAGTSDDAGSELDIVYVNKIPGVNNLSGLVKYADFSKGKVAGTTNDVTKVWVGLDYKFATN